MTPAPLPPRADDGALYSVVQTKCGGKWHIVSIWAAPNGLPKTLCWRVFSRHVLKKSGRRVYGRELGTVDLCLQCDLRRQEDKP